MHKYRHCPKCFHPAQSGAIFCSQCATRIDGPIRQKVPTVNIKPFVIAGGAVIAAMMVLVIVASIVTTQPQRASAPLYQAPPSSSLPAQFISEIEQASNITGKVVAVSDGDTIIVLDSDKKQHKIRLAGIDAPESGQDFANKAKQNLSALVYGKTVSVVGDKIDKYGRLVAKVLADGRDVNLEQVKAGYAWHYKKYEVEQSPADRQSYSEAESAARNTKANLWSHANPVAPWDFRANGSIPAELQDKIFGNKNSLKYHWAGCPGFVKIAEKNRVIFDTWEEAEDAGYTAVTNCSTPKPNKAPRAEDEREAGLDAVTAEANEPSDRYYVAPVPVQRSTPLPLYREAQTAPAPSNYSTPSRTYAEPAETQSSAPSAICADGSVSYSANRPGTCSHHGGVSTWLNGSTSPAYSPPSYSSPSTSDSDSYRPKTVNVRGYYRKDGTYVRPHTRSAPRRN